MTNRPAVFLPGSAAITVIATVLVLAGLGAVAMHSRMLRHSRMHASAEPAATMEVCVSASCRAADRLAAAENQTIPGRFSQFSTVALHRPALHPEEQAPLFVAQSR